MSAINRWKLARQAHRELVRDVIRWPDYKLRIALIMNPENILQERAEWLATPAGVEMLALAKRHAELLQEGP